MVSSNQKHSGYQLSSKGKRVTLAFLAEHLGVSITTISFVINDAPLAATIAQSTKDRIWEAVRKFNYQPNMYARYLHSNRMYVIAVLVPHIGDLYSASLLDGIETYLAQHGYFYFVVSHREAPDLIEKSPETLMDRAVEGMIFINTPLLRPVPVPIVAISDLTKGPNVSRIMVDNQAVASLAFSHLRMLGHREIAVFTGPSANGDSAKRWEGLRKAAKEAGLQISSDLVVELGRYGQSNRTAKSDSGYEAASRLIASGKRFTALIAFNDVSAIGAVRAFLDSGLRVPQDISVVGFDDIHEASFSVPRLTTVRQPLHEMGVLAAKTLLRRIKNEPQSLEDILIEPRLIVRESTRQLNR